MAAPARRWRSEIPGAACQCAASPDAAVAPSSPSCGVAACSTRPAAKPDPEADARQLEAEARDRAKRIAAARWIWEQETEPAGPLIETYLAAGSSSARSRATIRLHRSLYHHEANCRRPAMVCAVEHAEHGFVGCHCTYLAANGEGKATAIEPVKRFIGPVGGGAVRLAPATDTVAVCEGIENGLTTWRRPARRHGRRCRPAAFAR